jgi:hypothetical protein
VRIGTSKVSKSRRAQSHPSVGTGGRDRESIGVSEVQESRDLRPFESRNTDEVLAMDFRVDTCQKIREESGFGVSGILKYIRKRCIRNRKTPKCDIPTGQRNSVGHSGISGGQVARLIGFEVREKISPENFGIRIRDPAKSKVPTGKSSIGV